MLMDCIEGFVVLSLSWEPGMSSLSETVSSNRKSSKTEELKSTLSPKAQCVQIGALPGAEPPTQRESYTPRLLPSPILSGSLLAPAC